MGKMKQTTQIDPDGAKSMTDRTPPGENLIKYPPLRKPKRRSIDERPVRADYTAHDRDKEDDDGVPF